MERYRKAGTLCSLHSQKKDFKNVKRQKERGRETERYRKAGILQFFT